ncbi:glycosyltransferase family 4 protein [Peribacillus sp. NPDC096379]|uniref:glycosyltransferase family 4 protein n=1 Tax=Peribacillus sp. NPDC096379 TaxID=3364393 RepID=UPI0038112A92
MRKVLIVSTVSRQFYLFEQGNIEVLNSLGYEVHASANFSDANERLDALGIIRHPFDIQRSPFSLKNIKAYKQLKKIMKSENFDAVHCHSPMGGVLARLAAKSLGITAVIYTAHGFHFYKGAPFVNWVVYYPVEKFLARYTDHLITINKEDLYKANDFKAGQVHYVPGIGVDTNKFDDAVGRREEKRAELRIEEDTVVLLSIGEMIKRKNHETALRAIAKLENQNYVYLICGRGELDSYLQELTLSLGIQEKVRFLGFRNDIKEICIASDVFVFPSYQEGLPVSVMEAMSAGLPIIASEIRGNTDLIENGVGGYLLHPEDIDGFAASIQKVVNNTPLRQAMGTNNKTEVRKYDTSVVKNKMREIYSGL